MRSFAIAAAAALLAVPAIAQDAPREGLTEEQVRTFLDASFDEMQQLVDAGDWAGIQSWSEQRLSDTATIASRQTLLIADGPTMTVSMTMDADDLARFGGMMGRAHAPRIDDYSLEAEVLSVTELPGDEASAVVAIDESGLLAKPSAPEGETAQGETAQDETAQGEAGGAVFQSHSTCNLRLAPDGDSIVVKMIACDSVATMG